MIRAAADENFNGIVIETLCKRLNELDVIRIQDTAIYKAADSIVLEWAASENRVLLTHDANTLISDAYERVRQELPMPGVIEVSTAIPIRQAVDELELMIGAGKPEDFANQVKYVPIH